MYSEHTTTSSNCISKPVFVYYFIQLRGRKCTTKQH